MHDPISHYCSPNTFFSLIEKKQLWLTALSLSNDTLEGDWMANTWLRSFTQRTEKGRRQGRAARLLIQEARSNYEPLGVCFSEESDLLSQWRGYAADGAGFSVSFDPAKLRELTAPDTFRPPLMLTQVAYGDQDYDVISKVSKFLTEVFSEDIDKFEATDNGYLVASLEFSRDIRETRRQAIEKLFSVKNGAFREEREWRLYAVEPLSNYRNLEYRLSGNLISPYVKLSFPADAVERVTLGPTNPTPKEVVRGYLRKNGINAIVSDSAASYVRK